MAQEVGIKIILPNAHVKNGTNKSNQTFNKGVQAYALLPQLSLRLGLVLLLDATKQKVWLIIKLFY